ncbi:MAG: hypothetical protein GY744_15010 [Gammaproteobacteria bacterium]|nr:hypothetical protein [Gammaproteobacteria bacterium]
MFGFFKDRLERKRKEANELKLKKALSEKFFKYDETNSEKTAINLDDTDYTEVTIFGKRERVKKEHITIFDVSVYTSR